MGLVTPDMTKINGEGGKNDFISIIENDGHRVGKEQRASRDQWLAGTRFSPGREAFRMLQKVLQMASKQLKKFTAKKNKTPSLNLQNSQLPRKN